MTRITALAAAIVCLTGCFVFDKTFDTISQPVITFQIVVHGGPYAGTYVWNAQNSAYEGMVGSTRFIISMDVGGVWHMKDGMSNNIASSIILYGALPPTTSSGWSPADRFTSVDDGAGGVSGTTPDGIVSYGQTVGVTFSLSDPGARIAYQWQRAFSLSAGFSILPWTGSTYVIQSGDYGKWIRVIVTPSDATGTVMGTPVVSPPVRVS